MHGRFRVVAQHRVTRDGGRHSAKAWLLRGDDSDQAATARSRQNLIGDLEDCVQVEVASFHFLVFFVLWVLVIIHVAHYVHRIF